MTHAEVVKRLRKEHNKLVDLRDRYGLQDRGHGELHLAHFCLTGKLENASKVEAIDKVYNIE